MSEGFVGDLHMAELFFRAARRFKIEGPENRLCLIRRLAAKGKAKYLRDIESFTEGKSVIKITRKRNDNAN